MSLEAIIPHMTSNNTPAPFIASTSNQLATYAPFNAFQDNGGGWISDVANSHIQIDLGRPYKVSKVFIDTVSSWTGAKMKTLTLQASLDGTAWTDLYVGPTKDYKYTEEKEFGVYQHWRIRAGAMTMRGGCVRYFQLYGTPAGFADLEPNNIWVTTVPTTLKGTIYATHGKMDVRVLINDTVADDWYTFEGIVPVEYEYDPSLFRQGGNVITVQTRNEAGVVAEDIHLLYKLDFEIYKFNTSSYDFKIKNSPFKPANDGWLMQSYTMDYLNSELGVSYVFRYKPYAQMHSRVEDRPRLFDRILKENYDITSDQVVATRRQDKESIKQEGNQANISRLLDTIKSDQFKTALKEVGIIQRVFDSWAAINTENIGVNLDIKNSAVKKLKVSQDILQLHRLNARRKEMIQNALTLIQGYELGSRRVFDTVVEYYRAMEDFYPHKETILGGILLNAISKENIASKYPVLSPGKKSDMIVVISHENILGDTDEKDTWTKSNHYAEIFDNQHESIVGAYLLGRTPPKENTHVSTDVLLGTKEEMFGTKQDLSLGITETGQGTRYDVLMGMKEHNKEIHEVAFKGAHKDDKMREFIILESVLIHKNQKTKEFRIDEVQFVSKLSTDAYVESAREFIELMPIDATEKTLLTFVNKMNADSEIVQSMMGVDKMESDARLSDIASDFFNKENKDALNVDVLLQFVNKQGKASEVLISDLFFNKQNKEAWNIGNDILKVDKLYKDMRVDTEFAFTEKMNNKEAWPILNDVLIDKMDRDTFVSLMDSFTDDVGKNSYNFNEDIIYVDKVSHIMFHDDMLETVGKLEKQAFILVVLANFNALDKASIIHSNWEFAIKTIDSALSIDKDVRLSDKEERFTYLYEQDLAYIEDKKGMIIEQLLLDHVNLNGYIMDLMESNPGDRSDPQDAIKMKEILSDKDVALGFIQEGIDANRKNQEKEGYIPENTFVLAGDGSEWEDIWDRYSPGVDILDPPDSDYDYSQLAPAIYDLKTGVPKSPIGPSNKADVYVQTATSNPLPENKDVGVDDTKRIAVDNYIFIDCVLALESIKNRQKLRYAGMPVGKTIKEVFSQLYTWIQQAAPGHEEYERMFRFSRWYAEAVVLRNSKQILHRVYNPWQSSLHMGSGLGIEHVKHGWTYMTGVGTLDTTSLSSHLIFSKENYIDSEFVLRGYFDNPAGQGTMEISVDGVVVDSFSTHGVYERRIEIPQGNHSYDIFFYGTSGSASISSIEIGGTNFVSAHTTSDDSDVNGLKALTELMAQLLGYFELHHGGRKIKGTMEVRQRAVWNTHT